MTCRRAFEADLAAVLHGDGDPDFLAHVETCPECAAEVRVWRELDGLLHAGAVPAGTHPEPESLVAFVDAPGSLAADVRATIERHVADCRACADEARTLRGFDAAALASAREARHDVGALPPPEAESDQAGRGSAAHATALGWVGRVLWHPAFAYALVALLAVPLLREMLPKLSLPGKTEETRVVDARHAPPPAPKAAEAPLEMRRAPASVEGPSRRREAPDTLAARRSDEERAFARRPEAADEAPALRAAGRAAPSPVVLELQPEKPTVYDAAVVRPPVTLRVHRPSDLAPGPLAVTVRARADRREITAHASSADAIALDMPAGWLAPDDYVVTLQPLAGGAPVLLGFTVRAPTGPR